MKSYIFIKNAAILTVTSLVLRFCGIIFRIYLASSVGSEGLGLYQLIISVFMLFITFATAGMSTAVTRLVADNLHKGEGVVRHIMRVSCGIVIAVSLVLSSVMYIFARPLAVFVLCDQRLEISLKIMSLCIVFVGLTCCIRGYFIAKSRSLPPSVSQIFEELVRMAVIVGVLTLLKTDNVATLVAVVVLGDTVSEILATGLLYIMYIKDRKKRIKAEIFPCAKDICRISFPLSAGKYLQTGLHTAENVLIPQRLALFSGSRELGLSQFGAIKGMAIPILFFPASLLNAFSTLLIPEISRSYSANNTQKVTKTVERAVSVTLKLSICMAVVFFICGNDLGNIFYKDKQVGFIIRFLAPIVPFMYLESVATALLKGLDQQMKLFWFNCADSVVRIVLVLTVVPRLGLNGFLSIMTVSNIFTSMLTFVRLQRVTNIKVKTWEWVLKPLTITVFGGLMGYFFSQRISIELIRCLVCAIITVCVYLIAFLKEEFGVMSTKFFGKS